MLYFEFAHKNIFRKKKNPLAQTVSQRKPNRNK